MARRADDARVGKAVAHALHAGDTSLDLLAHDRAPAHLGTALEAARRPGRARAQHGSRCATKVIVFGESFVSTAASGRASSRVKESGGDTARAGTFVAPYELAPTADPNVLLDQGTIVVTRRRAGRP